MGRFYFDRKYFQGKAMRWVSFESTETLENTRKDIYGKCVPCITNLYEQLQAGKKELHLGQAFSCWKVVAVFNDEAECLGVLEEFEKRFLGDRRLKGRFGSGDETRTTRIIVFNAADEKEKELLFHQVKSCAERVCRNAEVSCHRGCAELYHDLLDDWRAWKEVEPIRKPELVPVVLDRIRRMLYWEKARKT